MPMPRGGMSLLVLLLSARMGRCLVPTTFIDSALRGGADDALAALENRAVDCDRSRAAQVLDLCAAVGSRRIGLGLEQNRALASEEKGLMRCYEALKTRGMCPTFGTGEIQVTERALDANRIREESGLGLEAFRPSPAGSLPFYFGAALICLAEVALANTLQIQPQPLLGTTAFLVASDQIVLNGALLDLALKNDDADERVVRHEAGHLLVAYLLGCPVQGCVLSTPEAVFDRGAEMRSAGTAFFDPKLNEAMRRGTLGRSVLDRYSIIVMAGIAAEAMSYGAAEGGRDDENALIGFLTTTVQHAEFRDPQKLTQQARWAALNALLLLKEHRPLYERLVASLKETRAKSIGDCILAIEDDP